MELLKHDLKIFISSNENIEHGLISVQLIMWIFPLISSRWAWGTCHSQENSVLKKIAILPYSASSVPISASTLPFNIECSNAPVCALKWNSSWGGCNVSHLMNGLFIQFYSETNVIFERWHKIWHVGFQRQRPQKSLCAFWHWTRAFDSLEEAGSSLVTFQKHFCC